MDGNPHAPLFMQFSSQEYWSGLPFPFPGDLSDLGSNLGLLHGKQILYHLRPGKPWPRAKRPPFFQPVLLKLWALEIHPSPNTLFILFIFLTVLCLLLQYAGFFLASHGLSSCSAWVHASWVLSSPTRNGTLIPSNGRRILNHWTMRKVPTLLLTF